MALLCFKNGSIVRECIRDRYSIGSWEAFEESLVSSHPGNEGNIGIFFHETEITPFAQGTFRFDKDNMKVESFSKDEEIRALVEGQFLAKRVHAEALGFYINKDTRILATGGASRNKAVLQVLSDVFHAPVLILPETANSACLGCAYRANYAFCETSGVDCTQVFAENVRHKLAVVPNVKTRDIYDKMAKRYKFLEGLISRMLCSTPRGDGELGLMHYR